MLFNNCKQFTGCYTSLSKKKNIEFEAFTIELRKKIYFALLIDLGIYRLKIFKTFRV